MKTIKLRHMKRIVTTIALALSVLMFSSAKNGASAQAGFDVGISYQTFYDELSPYGRWIDYPEYGYVWAPDIGPDFQPYRTGGHWVWSDEYDWMWVSDYTWGWAPFHYGRWFYDPFYGWMWVPGYEWSPAWVSWRTGGDYYGWAPLGPGISISVGFGNYNPPYNYWSFAPRRYINSHRISNYCVDRTRNVTIINNTTIINNYGSRRNVFVNGGPRRHEVERYAGRIRSVNFRETNRPGEREFRNNQVRLYRPQIQRRVDQHIAPRKFDRYETNRTDNNNRIGRRPGNNLPERIDRNNDRRFENRNDENRQHGNSNNDIINRRRNVFDRDINNRPNGEVNKSNGRQQESIDGNRRNVFDRNRNIDQPNTKQQSDNERQERKNVFDRNQNRRPQNRETEVRQFERRTKDMQSNGRVEKREIQQRGNNSLPQNNRREIRNETRPQRQYTPQADRQTQREFRGFENRKAQDQQGNGRGVNGRFDRKNR